jgi:hypothetical protein
MILERSWFDDVHTPNAGIWSALSGLGKDMSEKGLAPLRVVEAQQNHQPYDGVTTYCIKVECEPGKADEPFWKWWFANDVQFDKGFA